MCYRRTKQMRQNWNTLYRKAIYNVACLTVMTVILMCALNFDLAYLFLTLHVEHKKEREVT